MEEIGKILPKVLKPQLSRLEPPVVEVLAPLWTRVVGKALARQCRPVAFSAGTLTLAADDADWAEPLQQMAEEIRAHVNNFLGKPVVKHLRILRVGKLHRSDRAQWQPEHLPVSKPVRKDWPGKVSGLAPDMEQVIGRPYAKYFGRKHGKVA
jgi:predicted nucleic acid-binding Zn ribbon protein